MAFLDLFIVVADAARLNINKRKNMEAIDMSLTAIINAFLHAAYKDLNTSVLHTPLFG